MSEPNRAEGVSYDETNFAEFGDFDPLEARRLLKHFEARGVRFCVEGHDWMAPVNYGGSMRHYSQVRIFVHPTDEKKAEAILREEWKL